MSTGHTIARNSIWLLLDSLIQVLTLFACSIPVARVLGPTTLGYYGYVLWVAGVALRVAALGIGAAARKYTGECFGRGDFALGRAVLRTALKAQAVIAGTVVIAGMALVFLAVPPEHRLFSSLIVISLFPALMLGVYSGVITSATENSSYNVRASVVANAVNILGVWLTLALDWRLPGLTGAFLASRVVDTGMRAYQWSRISAGLPPGIATEIPREFRTRLARFCVESSLLLGLDILVWDRFEVVFLKQYSRIEEVAFYTNAFGIAANLLLLPRTLSWAAGASLFTRQGSAPETVPPLAVTSLRFTALFALMPSLGLAAVAEPLNRVLYGTQYLPGIPALTALAVLGVGRALMFPAQQLMMAVDRQAFMVRSGLLFGALNVLLAFLLIPGNGALGAAIAKGGVQILLMAYSWLHIAREFRVALPMGFLGRLLGASAVMMGLVRLVVMRLPPVLGLIAGVATGVVLALILLRLFRVFDAQDLHRLRDLERMLPSRARPSYQRVVDFVAGRPRPHRQL